MANTDYLASAGTLDRQELLNSDKCDLYFIRMEVAERPIKIGRSMATGKRFRMLQCGSPYRLTCLGLVYGEGSFEPAWHAHFAEQRMFGEWFRPSPQLEQAIEAAIKTGSRVALGLPEPFDWRKKLGLPNPYPSNPQTRGV
jgi:hypothetical protein